MKIRSTPMNIRVEPMKIRSTPMNIRVEPMKIRSTPVNIRVEPMKIRSTPVNIRVEPMKIRSTPMSIRVEPVKIRSTPMNIRVEPVKIRSTPVSIRVAPVKSRAPPPNPRASPLYAAAGALHHGPSRMRAFFDLLEKRASVAYLGDMRPPLTDEELEALRRAGILRPTERVDMDEISVADLARTLRALWRVQGRGLPVPASLGKAPDTLGWIVDAGGERSVVLVADPKYGLRNVTLRPWPTLALVPTARHLTPAMRAAHGPGATLVFEVLEESLTIRGGRIARAGARAPDAAELPAPHSSRAPHARAPAAGGVLFPGAKTWGEVAISIVNEHLLLVVVAGRRRRVSAADCGMATKAGHPTKAWELLHAVCDGNGTFMGRRFGAAQATKRTVSRLRRQLCSLFGFADDPFFPFRRKEGWHARFRACDRLPEGERKLSAEARRVLARAGKG
jgi:hypothetical protein